MTTRHQFYIVTPNGPKRFTLSPRAGEMEPQTSWASREEFLAELGTEFDLSPNGDGQYFEDDGSERGSSSNIQFISSEDPTSTAVFPFNYVLSELRAAYAEAVDSFGASSVPSAHDLGAAMLRHYGSRGTDTHINEDLFGGAASGIPAVIRETVERVPANSARAVGVLLNGNGRRTGVRGGSLSMQTGTKGAVEALRTALRTGDTWAELIAFLDTNESCRFTWGRKLKDIPDARLSSHDTLTHVSNMSCVVLAIWVKFAGDEFAAKILALMGGFSGDVGAFDDHVPRRVRVCRQSGRLFWEICRTIATHRGVDPRVFRDEQLDSPVLDLELSKLSAVLCIDVTILKHQWIADFVDMIANSDTLGADDPGDLTGGVVTEAEMTSFRNDHPSPSIVHFRGIRPTASKTHLARDRRNGTVILSCTGLMEDTSHVEVVLNPAVVHAILFNRYAKFDHDVVYDAHATDQKDKEDNGVPYFDRKATMLDPNRCIKPQRVYGGVESWNVDDFMDRPGSGVAPRFINTAAEFEEYRTDLVKNIKTAMAATRMSKADFSSLKYWFTRPVYIDVEALSQIVYDVAKRTVYGIDGLIEILSHLYYTMRDAKLGGQVSFAKFTSAMGAKRASVAFSRQVKDISRLKDGRVDVVTNFDNVTAFSITPMVASFRIPVIQPPKDSSGTGPEPKRRRLELLSPGDVPGDVEGQEITVFANIRTYSQKVLAIGQAYAKSDAAKELVKKASYRNGARMAAEWAAGQRGQASPDDIADQRRMFTERYQNNYNYDRLALAAGRKSILMTVSKNHPDFLGIFNSVYATSPAIDKEMLYVFAPQLDEPVVPIGSISSSDPDAAEGFRRRPQFDEKYYEIDLNMCYTSMLMGTMDGFLLPDLFGGKWINPGLRRPSSHTLTFDTEQFDFLCSYNADHGNVRVTNIDWATLARHFPEEFTNINSWYAFADTNPKGSVERDVPCASVIHWTAFVVGLVTPSQTHPCFPGAVTKVDRWIAFQRDILRLGPAQFTHDQTERVAIRLMQLPVGSGAKCVRSYATVPTATVRYKGPLEGRRYAAYWAGRKPISNAPNALLEGVITDEIEYDKRMSRMRGAFNNMFVEEHKLITTALDGDVDAARKFTKFDCNRAIGMCKTGAYIGSVFSRRESDVVAVNPTESDDGRTGVSYTLMGVVSSENTTQLHSCALVPPPTDGPGGVNVVLTEMAQVIPISRIQYTRDARIDVMERARLLIDELAIASRAFRVKTDAVFFRPDHLDDAIGFLNKCTRHAHCDAARCEVKDCRQGFKCSGDRVRHRFAICTKETCGDKKTNQFGLCPDHALFQETEGDLLRMAPYSVELFPGMTSPVADARDEQEILLDVYRKSHGAYDRTFEVPAFRRRVSDAGKQEELFKKEDAVVGWEVRTSDMLPGMDELPAGTLTPTVQQQLGPVTTFESKLAMHCWLRQNDGGTMFVETDAGEPDGLAYTVDTGSIYKQYADKQFDTLLEQVNDPDGGLIMEGPPGAGKSYTVCEFITRYTTAEGAGYPNRIFFVATATHLTLRPYQALNRLKNDFVKVCTLHSLVGVYKNMGEAMSNPRAWFDGKQGMKTGYRRHLAAVAKLPETSGRTPVTIFIDEYEMLPQGFEEILLFLAGQPDTNVILLGDPKQTAAYGQGVRCDGDVVRHISKRRKMIFDLPFRNPDPDYFEAQQLACSTDVRAFLKPPLSEYADLPGMDDSVYVELTKRVATAFLEAGRTGKPYAGPIVSVQNYKGLVMFTLQALDSIADVAEHTALWDKAFDNAELFVGHESCCFSGGDEADATGTEGNFDHDLSAGEESKRQTSSAEKTFLSRMFHARLGLAGPAGRRFYVGTKMVYEAGFSYRSTTAFRPCVRVGVYKPKSKSKTKAVRQDSVAMGDVLILKRRYTLMDYADGVPDWDRERPVVEFQSALDPTKLVVLTAEEMRMYMYYPFCLYTEGVVGQTFKDYTMIHMYNPRAAVQNYYCGLRRRIQYLYDKLGKYAHVARIAKTLNVATTRVLQGHRMQIIEVQCDGQGFWQDTVFKSKWHVAQRDDIAGQQKQYIQMRRVAYDGSRPSVIHVQSVVSDVVVNTA